MSAFALRHGHDPLRPPEAPGLGRGIAFAIAVHVGLVIAISINVQWRSKTIPAFEAELWSAVPQAAAPKEEMPPPEPEPNVKPQPKQPPGPTAEELQAEREAEIAIAKAKKKRALDMEAERKKQQSLKEKTEQDKQEKLEKQKQEKAEKAAEKAREAKQEALRKENLKRMMGLAGASGGPTATGAAQKSSGPSATYAGRVAARVKPKIIYNHDQAGNPLAEVEVRSAPDGTIISTRLITSSGIPKFDEAVRRAIESAGLPRDTDGTIPSPIIIGFRPLD